MAANTSRLAKNTLFLYFRMIIIMVISLYTSRVVLKELGIEDFGLYNVVGGFVAMFSILTSSLGIAISRFITFEMGSGNFDKLKTVFSCSLTTIALLAVVVGLIAEGVGLYALNHVLQIPEDRLDAAFWCFQFSLLSFVINLINVPYNASIIAHEKMKVFAYVSLVDALGRLVVAYGISFSPYDKLIVYCALLAFVSLNIRIIYTIYCAKTFLECKTSLLWNWPVIKEIFSFAGWSFVGTSAAVARDQGINVLMNIFFGPVVNAAKGITTQVNSAVYGFVQNFMTALNPQITKSYAGKEIIETSKLAFLGARFSYYMMLFMTLPILFNAEYILSLWLHEVPDHTVDFVKLTLVFAMVEAVSNPLITLQAATGKIKKYQLIVGSMIFLSFPISWIAFKLGCSSESSFIIIIAISVLCLMVRLILLREQIQFPSLTFVRKVLLNVATVSLCASFFPLLYSSCMQQTLFYFASSTLICFVSSTISIYLIGCNSSERKMIIEKVKSKIIFSRG